MVAQRIVRGDILVSALRMLALRSLSVSRARLGLLASVQVPLQVSPPLQVTKVSNGVAERSTRVTTDLLAPPFASPPLLLPPS